jgi:NAD(P)-dependent dehydrogenase (short-subunit alcohol dehydrogenase family)
MSARVGSTSDNRLGGWYGYRASKAGVNSLTKTFDLYLKQRAGEKAMAVALHPGTVKTGLSKEFWGGVGEGKLFEKEWVAERLVGVLNGLAVEGRGRCWDWKGEEILP